MDTSIMAPTKQPVLQVIIDEINYHIDDQDSWFFSGKTTLIDYDPQNGLTFHFFNGNGEPVDANTAASKGNTRFEGLWDWFRHSYDAAAI